MQRETMLLWKLPRPEAYPPAPSDATELLSAIYHAVLPVVRTLVDRVEDGCTPRTAGRGRVALEVSEFPWRGLLVASQETRNLYLSFRVGVNGPVVAWTEVTYHVTGSGQHARWGAQARSLGAVEAAAVYDTREIGREIRAALLRQSSSPRNRRALQALNNLI